MKLGNRTARYLTRDDGSWDKSSGSKDEQKLKAGMDTKQDEVTDSNWK